MSFSQFKDPICATHRPHITPGLTLQLDDSKPPPRFTSPSERDSRFLRPVLDHVLAASPTGLGPWVSSNFKLRKSYTYATLTLTPLKQQAFKLVLAVFGALPPNVSLTDDPPQGKRVTVKPKAAAWGSLDNGASGSSYLNRVPVLPLYGEYYIPNCTVQSTLHSKSCAPRDPGDPVRTRVRNRLNLPSLFDFPSETANALGSTGKHCATPSTTGTPEGFENQLLPSSYLAQIEPIPRHRSESRLSAAVLVQMKVVLQ
ncbi:hypothetical protein B0H16DRAFT_1688228 [Mycena metata]|uniref:Uncharacterized protein n=1 Tax=Mycena metata TaxID=1033252 RepID=A0AAD7JG90_9AGAR|nr:hypothetical protein B0H16DRAFT_1688228 [Mycena metata]